MPTPRVAASLLALLVVAACSVSTPKLAPGPPVTTASTTLPAVIDGSTTTTIPGATAPSVSVPIITSSCPDATKLSAGAVTKVATTKSGLDSIRVYPAKDGTVPCATLESPSKDYGQPPVFMVVSQDGDWVQVALPIRPNESSGWVRASDVQVAQLTYRIEVSLSGHRVKVFQGDEQLVDTPAGVGTGDTPTPPGVYYLVALIKPTNGGYGPYAYALSGHSETPGLETFGGGEGRLGLHGTDDPGSIGKDASHGCIRIPNDVITRMAEGIGLPLGVPVVVTA